MRLYSRHLASLIVAMLAIVAARGESYTPRQADLLFVIAGSGEMSGAIADATRIDTVAFDHVAMVAIGADGAPAVLEATPRYGVRVVDFEHFVAENGCVIVMRVNVPFDAEAAVASAWRHIGEEYDWWYMPDNGKMYCSELIAECFLLPDSTPLFSASPMTFKSADGSTPQFWVDLFQRLGVPIPEGVPGTNPATMSRSPMLTFIATIGE